MAKKVAQVTPRISLPILSKNERGYSLLEILLVLGIVAFIAAVGIPKLENTNSKMRREVRKLTVLMKRLHHLARLNRQTYRLVIQFPENDDHKFWVESSSKKVLFRPNDAKELSEEEKKKAEKENGFQQDKSVLRNVETLPTGIYFEVVETAADNQTLNSGTAYLHFFPEGLAEEAAVVLTDKHDLHWTIILNPLTGQAEIVDGKTTLKDYRKE